MATSIDEKGTHVTTSPQVWEQAAHQLSQAINRHVSKPIQQMQDMLADTKEVDVIAHVHPDTDVIGATSAMIMALVQRGIPAVVSYDESDLSAKSLLTTPGWERSVKYTDLDEDIDMWVAVGCASPRRLGALEDHAVASDHVINVDHRVTDTRFGTVSMVSESAGSSTMVLLGFFDVWGIKLTTPMAHALHAGLPTDTASSQFGRFRVRTVAAHLLDKGLDLRTTGVQLLEEHPFAYLPFLGEVFSATILMPEWGDGAGLVHVAIEYDRTAEVDHDEIGSVMDTVRTTNAVDVCAVLKEYEPGQWAVPLYSRELVDISQIALEVGGGGHKHAAGLTREHSKDELLQALLDTNNVVAQIRRDTSGIQGIVGLAKGQEAY